MCLKPIQSGITEIKRRSPPRLASTQGPLQGPHQPARLITSLTTSSGFQAFPAGLLLFSHPLTSLPQQHTHNRSINCLNSISHPLVMECATFTASSMIQSQPATPTQSTSSNSIQDCLQLVTGRVAVRSTRRHAREAPCVIN